MKVFGEPSFWMGYFSLVSSPQTHLQLRPTLYYSVSMSASIGWKVVLASLRRYGTHRLRQESRGCLCKSLVAEEIPMPELGEEFNWIRF